MRVEDLPFGSLATSLIALEITGTGASATSFEGSFAICAKLGLQLTPLMSSMGFEAILSRALAVARTKAPFLKEVTLSQEGTLLLADGGQEGSINEATWIIPAILIGLLVAFIGENITLRMILKIWPEVALSEMNFSKGHQHE